MNSYDAIYLSLPLLIYLVSIYKIKLAYAFLVMIMFSVFFTQPSSYAFYLYSVISSFLLITRASRIFKIDESLIKTYNNKKIELEKKLAQLKEKAEGIKLYERRNEIIYSLIKVMNLITDTSNLKSIERYLNDYTGHETSLIYHSEEGLRIIYGRNVELPCNDKDIIISDSFYAVNVKEKGRRIFSLVVHSNDKSDIDEVNILVKELSSSLKKIHLFEMIENMSQRDGVTGLFRRGIFNEKLSEEIIKARNFKHTVGLMMIDIDNFKDINDTYGHQVGDEVIREIAGIIKNSVYETDFVARYGGEEFAVIMPRAEIEGSRRKAEYIRNTVSSSKIRAGLVDIKVTISCGIAYFPYDAVDEERLVENADKALYHSKENGKNRVTLYRDISV
ncbi:MAG: GGDEF domain-containing protein [Elusimicrobiales bacterium]